MLKPKDNEFSNSLGYSHDTGRFYGFVSGDHDKVLHLELPRHERHVICAKDVIGYQPGNNSSPSWERACRRRREKPSGAGGPRILLAASQRPDIADHGYVIHQGEIATEFTSKAGKGRFPTVSSSTTFPGENWETCRVSSEPMEPPAPVISTDSPSNYSLNITEVQADWSSTQKVFQAHLPYLVKARLPINALSHAIEDFEFHLGLRALVDDLVNLLTFGRRNCNQQHTSHHALPPMPRYRWSCQAPSFRES